MPQSVPLSIAVARLGDRPTLPAMGGGVDYALKWNRMFAEAEPWPIGYAYDVPCYIPSMRLLKEGGYEVNSSMIDYGYDGRLERESEGRIGHCPDIDEGDRPRRLSARRFPEGPFRPRGP